MNTMNLAISPNDTVVVYRFGVLPPGLNDSGKGANRKRGLINMHHREYSELKQLWKTLISAATPPDFDGFGDGPVAMTVIRHSFGIMDRDNAWASMKPVMDGLIFAGVISDDNEEVVPWPRLIQIRAKKRMETGLTIHLSLLQNEERERELALRAWAKTIRPPTRDELSMSTVLQSMLPLP